MKKLFLGINAIVFAGLLTQSYQCIAGKEACFADPKSAKNYLLSQPSSTSFAESSKSQSHDQKKSSTANDSANTSKQTPQYATNYVFDAQNQVVKTEVTALTTSRQTSGKSLNATQTSANAIPSAININTADAMTLDQTLKGIGAKKAEAIVAHRQTHGAFQTVDGLADVKGIGTATIEKNRHLIKLTD